MVQAPATAFVNYRNVLRKNVMVAQLTTAILQFLHSAIHFICAELNNSIGLIRLLRYIDMSIFDFYIEIFRLFDKQFLFNGCVISMSFKMLL